MVKQILGAKSARASEATYRRLTPAIHIRAVLGNFPVAAALSALASGTLLAPATARAAECGGDIQHSVRGATFTFPGFSAGLASAIGSVVATTDAALQAQGSSALVSGSATQSPDQQAGGVWVRAVGGNILNSVPATASILLTLPLFAPPLSSTTAINCQSRVRQGFDGVQVGADVARLNWGGSDGSLHVGLTSGRVETSAVTNQSSTNINFQVPFFGLYSTFTYGGLFADAQIRGNFYEGSLTNAGAAISGQEINGRGFTVSGNIGYNYSLPADWFIEPSAGVNWSRTFIDSVNFSTIQNVTRSFFGRFSDLDLSNLSIHDFDSK